MKKFMILCIGLMCIFFTNKVAFAKNGDVVGNIYSTDIRAYINGVEVESYNIGGKTAVVIEDIFKENSHQCIYDDSARTLKFFSLIPGYLVKESSVGNVKPGKIIGNIYETDIKTSIYDVVIPSFNIGGKTAVAIEDLGYNGAFSPIGGKFIWNGEERTISLEFLYPRTNYLSRDKNIILTANEEMTEMSATFKEGFHCDGGKEYYEFPEYVNDDAPIETIMPIKAGEEIIGYYLRRPSKSYKFTAFTHYYPDKLKEAEKTYIPAPAKTRDEIIWHFTGLHSVGEPRERFDSEDYSFVYISVAGTSWTSYNLVQAFDDGTYIDYSNEIETTNRSPINLVIDKENEKVTFRHVDRYNAEWFTDYEINLKARKIKALNNLETDIGLGTTDGNPHESEQNESRNEQYEYKLVSDNTEKIVNGFFAHEYYYADMLPLAETFEFFNIKYTFANNILTIDTSEAKPFKVEKTDNKIDFLADNPIEYLLVDKVLLNGAETQITYPYLSGHFDNTTSGRAVAKPYVCNGKVYINASFVNWLYNTAK